jgi:hypothetical protein
MIRTALLALGLCLVLPVVVGEWRALWRRRR